MRDVRELNVNEGGEPVLRPAPTSDQIAEFQDAFSLVLPVDYLALLQYSNGGHPELDSFQPVGAEEDELWGVNRFYHLSDDREDLEGVWAATEEWQDATGLSLVPIANDGGGNQIVLDYSSVPPRVAICIHDDEFRLVVAAATFGDFIDLLRIDPTL